MGLNLAIMGCPLSAPAIGTTEWTWLGTMVREKASGLVFSFLMYSPNFSKLHRQKVTLHLLNAVVMKPKRYVTILNKTPGTANGTDVLISTMVYHLDRQVTTNARLIPSLKAGLCFQERAALIAHGQLWNRWIKDLSGVSIRWSNYWILLLTNQIWIPVILRDTFPGSGKMAVSIHMQLYGWQWHSQN